MQRPIVGLCPFTPGVLLLWLRLGLRGLVELLLEANQGGQGTVPRTDVQGWWCLEDARL